MPRKSKPHRIKSENNIFKEVTNPWTGADGIMHNQSADNQLQATIGKSSGKMVHGLSFGTTYHQRNMDKKTKRPIGCQVIASIKNVSTEEITDFIMDNGEIIPASDIERKGMTKSGFIQMSKYKQ